MSKAMKKEELLILRFMQLLATLRAIFRKTHIFLESVERFKMVSTHVIPFQQIENSFENSDQETLGVSISFAIDADLKQPSDVNHASIGVSLKLWHVENRWKAEAEIGWSGSDIGWDPFDDKEIETDNIEQLIDKLPEFTETFLDHFKRVVSDIDIKGDVH